MANLPKAPYDALIVGGSTAGLAAALALGRSLRRVLVIDAGEPCNRQTRTAHNYLTRDGITREEFREVALQDVAAYPTVGFEVGSVVTAEKMDSGFVVETADGRTFAARKVLLATGVRDLMPDIPGFGESWGISVLHCPYCHGYEVRGQRLVVLVSGEMTLERVSQIRQWSPRLTWLTNGPAEVTPEVRATIERLGVPLVETPVERFEHETGQVSAVRFSDSTTLEVDAVFAHVPFRQHTDLAAQLGCDMTEAGHVSVNALQQTTAAGVYGAGDATTFMRAQAVTSASGNIAGAMLNRELTGEEVSAEAGK